ncbi:MAG: hypothetical protein AAF940_10120 [Pseudomonadota bacterium]
MTEKDRGARRGSDQVQCFSCYGARIEVSSPDAFIVDALPALVPPHAQMTALENTDVQVRVRSHDGDAWQIMTSISDVPVRATTARIFHELQSSLHDAVAQYARGYLFVHAGVVAVDGKAIVAPGKTMTGKTTLVRALIDLGAHYVSDEFAVLSQDGLVHPYPKPLSMRDEHGVANLVKPEQVGAKLQVDPVPVGLVARTSYEEGSVWQPTPMGAAETLLALLANTVAVRTVPALTMQVLGVVSENCTGLGGTRGEAEACANALIEQLSQA